MAYNSRMMAAYSGRSAYPRIRTFNKSQASSNSIFSNIEEGEKW